MASPKHSRDETSSQKSGTEARLHALGSGDSEPSTPKDIKFWLVFLAICITLFLSALDLVSDISTLWYTFPMLTALDRRLYRAAYHRS